MSIRVLLMDIDDTLFDFHASSRAALALACADFGLRFSDALFARYAQLDAALWQQYERGEIEKKDLYIRRFRVLFDELHVRLEPADFNARYFKALGEQRRFMPHCEQALRQLHEQYKIHIVTNGDAALQQRRIAVSGMAQFFDGVFISELLGSKKPDRAFFDAVFAEIGEAQRAQSIIIGDSLSSDMQGGRNAGIRTCLYGRRGCADARCDYVVEDLLELPSLLAQL